MTIDSYFTLAVAKLHRVLTKTLDVQLYDHGLTAAQIYTLQAVENNPCSTLTMLGCILQADRSTVSRGLEVLSRAKLVNLKTSLTKSGESDLRKKEVFLTDKGKKALQLGEVILAAADKLIESLWVQANMRVLEDLLANKDERPTPIAPNVQLRRSVDHFLALLKMTKLREV